YAHLSDDLAPPEVATRVLVELEATLEDEFDLLRAPFGWYKRFDLRCKGHPLSELSRHVSAELAEEEAAIEAAERPPSEWEVHFPGGDRVDPEVALDDVDDRMQALITEEVLGGSGAKGEAPHVSLMQEKVFAGYDGLSDVGNLRWYPRGKLVRDQLMAYVTGLVVAYGGMPVETPIMYDLGARAISEHADKFGERQYRFESGSRKLMLRFAACFGQFSIMRDMHISANDLPLRVYEMSTYSFRREQRGEVSGLRRLRAFTMPDMHTATRDVDHALEEFERQAELALDIGDDLAVRFAPIFRMTTDFYEAHTDWVAALVDDLDTPVLVELIPERGHRYWVAKIDFAAVDGTGRPFECSTVQIDVESAERFDIEYTDGEEVGHPTILHYSPSGGIERVFAAILEDAAREETPQLPTWLSPTQVRFIPVQPEAHLEACEALADRLVERDIRADIDDRDESVGKRIATAETDWVPYYIVVGNREIEGETYGVNDRARGDEIDMSFDELGDHLEDELADFPRRPRYLPRHVSEHPRFI
ncbi:MAG: threonine--tRNA ligase, partial [Halobacteriota archaeon]